MTAFRAVRPNRAWDAKSSSPMYASTSTIRATRSPCSRMSRAPIRPRAASSVGPARSRRSRSGGSTSVVLLDRLGKEEPEDVDDARDDRPMEDVSGPRRIKRLPERPQERQLVDVLGQVQEEVRVEDDRQEREEHQGLED